jgi:hypothetical protein
MAGVLFLAVARDSSVIHNFQTGIGATLLSIQWVSGVLSAGVKRQGGEADGSPPSAEVKNGGAIPLLSDMLIA